MHELQPFLSKIVLIGVSIAAIFLSMLWTTRRDRFGAFIEAARKSDFKFISLNESDAGVNPRFAMIRGANDGYFFLISEIFNAKGKPRYSLMMVDSSILYFVRPSKYGNGTIGGSGDSKTLSEVFPRLLAAARIRSDFQRKAR